MARRPDPPTPSPVRAGERVSHYEILSEIGRGGMGIVFLALDLRLGREVALKCPWDDGPPNAEACRRFAREARAVAQLASPHVVPIFEVFEAAGLPWIAMERVEGRSLRQRLEEGGPLPLCEALRHGESVAEALAVAHEHGILHRDVTPNNVLISEDGRARLTDFGLARFLAAGGGSEASTRGTTGAGHVLGTPGYMSPEQASGLPVGPRSDLYELGAVLHAMCTGGPAPLGPREGEVASAIRRRLAPGAVPGTSDLALEAEQLVRRAMAPHPEDRFETARAMLAALQALRHRLESTGEHAPAPPAAATRRRALRVPLAASVAIAIALAAWWILSRPRAPAALSVVAEAVVTWPSQEADGRISPDGRWLTFLCDRDGRRRVWAQPFGSGEARPVTTTDEDTAGHVWSPTGDEIACLVRRAHGGFLEILPMPLGGRPRLSVPLGPDISRLVRWIGDHVYLESFSNELLRLDLGTGTLRPVPLGTSLPPTRIDFDVRSDESTAVFSAVGRSDEDLWTARLDRSDARPLLETPFRALNPMWVGRAGDRVAFISNRTGQIDLWEIAVAGGGQRQLPFGGSINRLDDVSPDGSLLVLETVDDASNLWWLDPEGGRQAQLTADTRRDFGAAVSRSGELIAFQRTRSGDSIELGAMRSEILVTRRAASGIEEPLRVATDGFDPHPSPDGRWVAYARTEGSGLAIWVQDLQSHLAHRVTGGLPLPSVRLFPVGTLGTAMAWSAEGDRLFTAGRSASGAPEVREWRPDLPTDPGRTLFAGDDPGTAVRNLRPSPNGRFLAFVLEPLDRSAWEIRQLDLGSLAVVVRLAERQRSGSLLGWAADGKGLVAIADRLRPDDTSELTILVVPPGSGPRIVATAPSGFPETARLDAARGRLYLTLVDDRLHNVYRGDLAGGPWSRVTDNTLPGITYAGVAVLTDGTLVASRQKSNTDIWTLHVGEERHAPDPIEENP
jgi:Tol biopolymer transport system component/aminoglycoside phosphotransferase (APT) family kinase protein